ncbi:MAG: DUF1461 domain-containing protein [Candidatus Woesebacteria bacterium]
MKTLVVLSLIILPIWWIFFLIWQPAVVHFVANNSSPAIDRALEYATRGGSQVEDIYFTKDEIAHLKDVSRLYTPISVTISLLALGAWPVLIVAVVDKIKLQSSFKRAAKTLGVLVIVLLLCLALFPLFFETFHEVLFPQGNWSFPADSMLITIFPEIFWKLILSSLIGALGIFAALYWILGNKNE